jgi:hypothetical protein
MTIAPFAPFAPDQSRFNPNASAFTVNCKPTKDGWGPLKSLVGVSNALPSAPRGGIAVKADDGSWKVFAGTATNLYRLDSSAYTWTEISSATDAYSLADGVFWSFARFGDKLVATAVGSTRPQFVDIDTSDDFANLTNATFEAAIAATVGDFLVFGQIDGDKRKIKWSGVNDITFWTKARRGSDEQVFPDGGAIQAILPQALNAIVVQEFGIRQMLMDPESGLAFRFMITDPERGAFAPRSVVNIGLNDFCYLAKDGFYRGIQAQPIGAEKVDRWFFENCASDKYDLVSGTADPFDKIIWWRFEDSDGVSKMLGYDWQLDRWMYRTTDALDLFPAATAGLTLGSLDALYPTIADMPYVLGSRFYQGGIPGLAGFTSDYKFGFFDGSSLEAIIETEDKMLNYPRRALTDRVTPIIDTNDAQLAIAAKETQAGTLTYGDYKSQHSGTPTIPYQVSGRIHKFRVKVPAGTDWNSAVGVDIAFSDDGEW